ncbi:MAG TPA: protein-disulfide reductase DsbD domain-containing protein [Pyrinomonadaceae bacterium]|nr:protein-disulfide reductase DsbD domain-containing protein [Pyrinomonadaceae bacterium]
MNKKAILLLLVALSACSNNSSQTNQANAPANSSNVAATNVATNAATPAPKSQVEGMVSASAEKVALSAGGKAQGAVRLSIAGGYHVNANPAAEEFLIPTTLEVAPEPGITVSKIVYPKPLTKKFSFNKDPLAVYEGDAAITFALGAARDAAKGAHTLRARVRVQPCDDEKCYPPTTIETSIPVQVE